MEMSFGYTFTVENINAERHTKLMNIFRSKLTIVYALHWVILVNVHPEKRGFFYHSFYLLFYV